MSQVLIDPGFFTAISRLAANEQARVVAFLTSFYENPKHPSIQLHTIDATRGKGLWSGRVTQDLRAILHKDRDTWILLHVDHHDAAYQWAERRDVGRHPITGALQIVESVETIREVDNAVGASAVLRATGLFARHEDAYLLSLGVPTDWLPTLRKVTSEDELLLVCEKLGPEVAERLLDLASGQLVTPPSPLPAEKPLTESSDTRRRFFVADDADELRAVLAAPLDCWIAFLHPSQRAIVEASPKGPVKVSGSAGTGKTVVALHRARSLARKNQRVLLTSYVTTLCENLSRSLRKLCSAEELSRITVSTVHKQALDLVREVEPRIRPASEEEVRSLLESIGRRHAPAFEPAFVRAEWEHVVQLYGITSWPEYRTAKRTGRGRALSTADRKTLWQVFEGVQNGLRNRQLADWPSLCRRAEELIVEGKISSPFDAVVVDELQDLKPPELRFLRTLTAANPGNLLLAGDAAQRIYSGAFTLSALGIDVRGRSHVLRLNYRTTEQIRRVADKLLGDAIDDLDGSTEKRTATRSLLRGPRPVFQSFASETDELSGVVSWLQARMVDGLRAEDMACFARSGKAVERLAEALRAAVIPTQMLSDTSGEGTGVHLGTMHRAKGLEFKAVLVFDCAKGSLPSPTALKGVTDPLDRENAEARERQLLYVAMTRARDELMITWSGEPSPFLTKLDRGEQST